MNKKISHMFTEIVIISVLRKTILVIGYNSTCPTDGHWYLRSLKCNPITSYVCLFDDINGKFVETCDGKKEVGKGYKYVIRQNIDRDSCAVNTYQPSKFTTYKQSKCLYQKSLCSEEGQISANNGSAISDRACRCDYTKGYAFIFEPKNKCFCFPVEEDCSCFVIICNGKQKNLSPDYECSEGEMTFCPPIRKDFTGNKSFQINKKAAYNGNQSSDDSFGNAIKATISIVCTCFIITPVIFFMVEKFLINYLKDVYCIESETECFQKHLEDVFCMEGESALFICETKCMDKRPTWFKNQEKLQQSTNIIFSSEGYTHKLVIYTVSKDDRGLYSVEIGKSKSQASLMIRDPFQKHLEDLYCMEGESALFICETKCMDECPIWFKNNDKLQQSKNIMFMSQGCTCILIIYKVSKDDRGLYSVEIGQSKSQASLMIRDGFTKHLEDVYCIEGEAALFICETICTDERPTWFKYNDRLQQSTNIIFSSEEYTHKLVINKVSKDDTGLYSVEIGQSKSQASLMIRDAGM